MNKILHKVICLLMLVSCFLPVYSVTGQAESNKKYIIATDTTFAPFEFQDKDGNYVGIDMDLFQAIAKDQGFAYEMKPLGFNAAVQALETGQVDAVIAGMSITDKRKEVFDFSDPYYQAGVRFAVLDKTQAESLADLKGMTIACKTGTTGATVAEQLKDQYGYHVTQFEDSVNMYQDLQVGNAQAVIEDYPVMAYASQSGQVPLKFLGEEMEVVDYGIAVQKGQNAELLQHINQGLTNIKASGEYDAIVKKYLGDTGSKTQGIGALLQENGMTLIAGLAKTLLISLISIAIALVIGVVVGLMETSDVAVLRWMSQLYVDLMRGVPLIVLSFFIYFGIPQLTGWQFSSVVAGVITLSLNAGAYIGEIVRGGIQAVDGGQDEAARSLGMPKGKTLQKIILPQAIKIMVPSFINQFVITIKDTSILSVIGLVELTQTGRIIIARTYQSGNMWLIVGVMYVIVITLLTRLSTRLERKYIK